MAFFITMCLLLSLGLLATIYPNAFLDNYRGRTAFIEKPFVTTSFKQSGILPHELPSVTPSPHAPSFVVLASGASGGQGEVVTRASLGKTLTQCVQDLISIRTQVDIIER